VLKILARWRPVDVQPSNRENAMYRIAKNAKNYVNPTCYLSVVSLPKDERVLWQLRHSNLPDWMRRGKIQSAELPALYLLILVQRSCCFSNISDGVHISGEAVMLWYLLFPKTEADSHRSSRLVPWQDAHHCTACFFHVPTTIKSFESLKILKNYTTKK